MKQHASIPAFLVIAILAGGFVAGGVFGQADAQNSNRQESAETIVDAPKTNGPVAKPEPPTRQKSKSAKPPPSFKATEEVPVDMAVDFPSDI